MKLKTRRWIAASAAALALVPAISACGDDAPAPKPPTSTAAPPPIAPAAAAPRKLIPVDDRGCIDMKAHKYDAIPLTGKLVVTYFEPTLKEKACDWDEETATYWCPSATKTSAECAEVSGVIWCPNSSPPPEALGDPQELALFDLTKTNAVPERWTNNLEHEAELDISPDGKKIVYAVRARMDAFEEGKGIWVVDSDGKNARQVVDRTGHTGIPTWLPPGNDRFTFIAEGLHVFDLATSTTITVKVDGFDPNLIIDPEASHDGKRMTFKGDASGGNVPNIYVMDFDGAAGSNVKQLTRGFSDHDPVFSRDGRKIYFERYYGSGEWDQQLDRSENPDINQWGIVEVDPQSSEERVLVPHDKCGVHFWWLPTVSPDGKHLMFIHDVVGEDGYQDLWVSDINGENAQPVPGTRGFHWFDWSE